MKHSLQVFSLSLLLVSSSLLAQSEDPGAPPKEEQKAAIAKAEKDFAASDWKTSFDEFKVLHEQLPQKVEMAEYLAEAALNLDQFDYAQEILAPLVVENANHWRAVALEARYDAQTGRDKERDAELARLQEMYDSGRHAKLSALNTMLLESHKKSDGGTIRIWYSLKPWGRFNAYLYARLCDATGKETAFMDLESADIDQALWAKSHPDRAAAGERVFTLDLTGVPVKNPDGTATGFHATMGFFDGKPAYNLIRDKMIAAANRPEPPISKSTLTLPSSTSAVPFK